MLMMFPGDARNNSSISKAVAGFGLLRYWHDTSNKARIVVKVQMHDDAEVPHDVVVSAGLPPRVRSWTCPVYILKRRGVDVLGDEDFFPPNGALYPIPVDPPRWMGFHVQANDPAGSVVDGSVGAGSVGGTDHEDMPVEVPEDAPATENPSGDPLPTDEQALVPVASPIPVINSSVGTVTWLLPSGQGGPSDSALIGPMPPLVPYAESDDKDVVEVQGPINSSKRRRAHKMKEPLDASFLRRSKRINPDIGGFRNEQSAQEAADNPAVYSSGAQEAAVIAPYLSIDNIQGIATNFLQMQPEAVAAAALLELDDDDDA